MTDHTRTTAKLASWGIVLTVLGFALGIAAAHHSAFLNAWTASGRPFVTYDEYGGEWPVANWAPWVAWLAGVVIVVGTWCLVAVVWRLAARADRADPHRPPHRSGAPLPPAVLALPEPNGDDAPVGPAAGPARVAE